MKTYIKALIIVGIVLAAMYIVFVIMAGTYITPKKPTPAEQKQLLHNYVQKLNQNQNQTGITTK